MKKIMGKCHICQKYTELTYEHIPPYRAFNSQPAKSIEGEEMLKLITNDEKMPWEIERLKYKQKQRGMGMYSLCKNCNNTTGSFYGTEYIKFANTIDMHFPEIIKNCKENGTKTTGIDIKGMRPLLFAKQVLSMFCSTCPNITKKDKHIINLLLKKDLTGLNPKKYRLSMFLLNQYKIGYTGIQAQLIAGIGSRLVATIDAYPFGFVLEIDPNDNFVNPELDITDFFNSYENKDYDMHFGLPILERNIAFPCDYRTKEEIKACAYESKKYKDNNQQ